MAISKELLVRIGGDARGIQRAGKTSQAVLRRIGRSAKDVTRSVGRIGLAVAGIGFATKRLFLDPFAEQQDALASLSQALASTGKVGQASLKLIADEAARLQSLTKFGDEALIKASATLATLAPALAASELAKAQKAIAGIADTFLKGDLEAAALLLGKTLGGTVNALSRYGISVDTSATASEKLASILGSASLGAAFDVAQAKAKTFAGRLAQLGNVAGDLRETIGEIIVHTFGFTEGAQSMAEKLSDLNERIAANSAEWSAWGGVVIKSVKFAADALGGLVRIAFNVGEMIGRAMNIAWSTMKAKALEFFNDIVADMNTMIELLNRLPGVNIKLFDLDRSAQFAAFLDAREQTKLFMGDLDDIGDAVMGIADAWLAVQDATEKARNASGSIGSGLPSIGGDSVTARINFLLSQANVSSAAIPRSGFAFAGGGGVSVAGGLTPTQRAQKAATLELANASDIAVASFENMANAIVGSAQTIEQAMISSLQNVIANIKTPGGGLFGATLAGGLVGVGLGLVGGLFGRDRSPVKVQVEDYSSTALAKLKNNSGEPIHITTIIEQGGVEIERIERELHDRQNRDEVVRFGRTFVGSR